MAYFDTVTSWMFGFVCLFVFCEYVFIFSTSVPDSGCSSSQPSIKPAEVTDDITVLGRIKDNDEWVQRRTPGSMATENTTYH